jgi:hypothetical protein
MLSINVDQKEFFFFGLLVFAGIAIQIFVSKKLERIFSYHQGYSVISLIFIISSLFIMTFPLVAGNMRTAIQIVSYFLIIFGLILLILLILLEPSGLDFGTPIIKCANYVKARVHR